MAVFKDEAEVYQYIGGIFEEALADPVIGQKFAESGVILKVVHTHRYQLTARGRTILAALQAARQANPDQPIPINSPNWPPKPNPRGRQRTATLLVKSESAQGNT